MPQVPPIHPIHETRTNIVAEGTQLDGNVTFDVVTRFHGRLKGKLLGKPNCKIILGEASMVEGEIHADTLMVSGYVQGNIKADSKITLLNTARVFGNIETPSIVVEAGAIYEGKCKIIEKPHRAILDPLPSLA